MTEEIELQEWTCLGAHWTGSKLIYGYKRPGGEGWFNRAMTPQSPGGKFTMSVEGEAVYYKGAKRDPVWVGWDEDADRILLTAQHQSALAAARMAKSAKKDMAASALEELLAPIAHEYQSRNRTGQAALLGTIIQAITKIR